MSLNMHIFPVGKDADKRLWAKLQDVGDCWEWTGKIANHGYGVIYIPFTKYKTDYVHRVVYREVHGVEIGKGMHIDHLCRNTKCGNPLHLEEVTQKENMRRGNAVASHNALHFISTHCAHGHPWDEENTRYSKDGHVRYCRTCGRNKQREYQRRKKLERTDCETFKEVSNG